MSLHVRSEALGAIQRRVRPRKEASDDESISSESSGDVKGRDSDGLEVGQDVDIGSVSFGALAKAQSSFNIRNNSSGREIPHRQFQDLDGMRQRQNARDFTGEGLPRKERREAPGRSSKHAPTELPSRKAVSRKREVVVVPKRESRDPRFDPLTGPLNERKMKKDYAFLESYRESEMKSIKDEIKRAKDEGEKEKLKRELLSMESKKKAREAKDKHQEILDTHRKKEKELVRQGKKPFYLKRAEQKKLALMERYSKLKGKQLNHVIERKRKKKASKERRNMPSLRREVES